MRTQIVASLLAFDALGAFGAAEAQEPVVAAPDPEALFTDADPVKHANKQVVLHILRELLQCNYWEQADRWLTERYLQHNPNVTSGRDNVVAYFAGQPRAEKCDKLTMPIVTVLTSDDIVGVVFRMQYDDPRNEGQKYTSIWYDQWRIVDGRADEHWDTAQLGPPVTAQ
jgi:predicted SnoaL-like aldol condensation-catalyzing enzyme